MVQLSNIWYNMYLYGICGILYGSIPFYMVLISFNFNILKRVYRVRRRIYKQTMVQINNNVEMKWNNYKKSSLFNKKVVNASEFIWFNSLQFCCVTNTPIHLLLYHLLTALVKCSNGAYNYIPAESKAIRDLLIM